MAVKDLTSTKSVMLMIGLSRQLAALLCVFTFAWQIFIDSQNIENDSLWILLLHFVYFQLPLRSRALSFFHPISFVGAIVTPICYLTLIYYKESIFREQMEQWDITWAGIIIRSITIYLLPLIFHCVDILSNQSQLILSYQTKPRKFQYFWSLTSFFLFGMIHEFFFSDTREEGGIESNGILSFPYVKKCITIILSIFANLILYLIIYKKAYPIRWGRKKSSMSE